MKKPLKICITTGDIDGIGMEISAKALAKLKPKKDVIFYLWRSPKTPKKFLDIIDGAFRRVTVSTWPEALKHTPANHKELIDIASHLPPALWVEQCAKANQFGHVDALATAPLSKTSIADAGLKDIGHTQILQRVAKRKSAHMAFVGNKFSVILATAHIPVNEIQSSLNVRILRSAINAGKVVRSLLPSRDQRKSIGLLGLNPHAGEEGMIGKLEQTLHKPLLREFKKSDLIDGPLVPDAAFFESNWKKYSVYIANYHDQGLIPFKMIHGQHSGLHITMGLPFIRTSVDHGTAKDIFGKNKADPSSMLEAIEWAIKLAKKDVDLSINKAPPRTSKKKV